MIYSLISFITMPFYLLALYWRGNAGILRHRLGFLPRMHGESVWIHAASMGEMASLHGLVTQLQKANKSILISTNTTTGYRYITTHFAQVTPAYLPLDTLITLNCAFRRVKPTHLIVTEAERWLCLFKTARSFKDITVIAYNTYLRPQAMHSVLKRFWYTHLYQHCHHIYTQHTAPFALLTLPHTYVHELGSPKAASVVLKKKHYHTQVRGSALPVLLVGSVHPDELEIYLHLYQELRATKHDIHMILIPRHLHWASDLQKQVNMLEASNHHYDQSKGDTPASVIQSITSNLTTPGITTVSVLGVLYDLYQHATIFYLGGTFNAVGGHNVLEPAVWQLPILTGPTISSTNFEALALERAGGLHRCRDKNKLAAHTTDLLDHLDLCQATGIKNAAWTKHQAAQDITL